MAAKLAIKMVIPMVLFIFPGVFIVILGPAFIVIIRDLLPTLAGN
jgi:tight adherence protein C